MELKAEGNEIEFDGETFTARGVGRLAHFALAGPGMKNQDVVLTRDDIERVEFDDAGAVSAGALTIHTSDAKYNLPFRKDKADVFKELYKALTGLDVAKAPSGKEAKQHDGKYEGIEIKEESLIHKGKRWPIKDCEATVDHGANIASRITATRVALGTVLLPGIGTIVGALAKKNRSKVYLAIEVPGDDLVLVELKAKKEGEARQFAAKVNKAASYWSE